MLCTVSTLRLLSVLHHTTHLVLVVLQTSFGRHPHARMIATVMWSDSGSLFLSCELAASIVFRDNVDGVGENMGCALLTSIVVFQD